jgi:hypothetical protein
MENGRNFLLCFWPGVTFPKLDITDGRSRCADPFRQLCLCQMRPLAKPAEAVHLASASSESTTKWKIIFSISF